MSIMSKKIIQDGSELDIVFYENTLYQLDFSDFISASIAGVMKDRNVLKNKNFLYSKLHHLKMIGLCFPGCDFLDSILDECKFFKCDLSGQHFTSSKLYKTEFESCLLAETNYQSSIFEKCIFIDCEFSNILMKTCTFINCKFINCKTSNKLFESCLLLNCSFNKIELQMQTIFDNFGLDKRLCTDVILRDKRKREKYKEFSLEDILSTDIKKLKDEIHIFNYFYFIDGMSINSYESLFKILEQPSWLVQGASSSIINRIENLTSFLLYLYNNNEIMFLPVIKLSDLVKNATNEVENIKTIEAKKLARCLYGVTHELANDLSSFLYKVSKTVHYLDHDNIILEGYGPLDCYYYQDLFEHLGDDIKVVSVKPKNSPNFIKCTGKYAAMWAIVSLILTIQYKHSIEDINTENFLPKHELAQTEEILNQQLVNSYPSNIGNLSSYSSTIGFLDTEGEVGFQAISIFSNGMIETLRISISAKRALELQATIIGFAKTKI